MTARELEIRRMRDIVFGKPTTDWNWDYCRDNWMRADSVRWLEEQIKINENKTKEE